MATGSEDGGLCVWSGVGGGEARVVARGKAAGGSGGGVCALAWHPSKNEVAVADDKGQVRLKCAHDARVLILRH